MKILIVSASQRANSQSRRIAGQLLKYLAGHDGVTGNVIDLHKTKLPQWETDFIDVAARGGHDWPALSQQVRSADGFVFVVPEWHGMASPALKNFILYCNDWELAHKATLIVAVSAGMSGAYPVAELRAGSSKNSKICYIPDHLVIKNCKDHLLDPAPDSPTDEQAYICERAENSIRILLLYAKHLNELRKGGSDILAKYPHGM